MNYRIDEQTKEELKSYVEKISNAHTNPYHFVISFDILPLDKIAIHYIIDELCIPVLTDIIIEYMSSIIMQCSGYGKGKKRCIFFDYAEVFNNIVMFESMLVKNNPQPIIPFIPTNAQIIRMISDIVLMT